MYAKRVTMVTHVLSPDQAVNKHYQRRLCKILFGDNVNRRKRINERILDVRSSNATACIRDTKQTSLIG